MAVARDPSLVRGHFLTDFPGVDYDVLSYEEEDFYEDLSMYLYNEVDAARLYRGVCGQNQKNNQPRNYTEYVKAKKPSKSVGVQTKGQVEGLRPAWVVEMEDQANVLCTELSNIINMLFHDPCITKIKKRKGDLDCLLSKPDRSILKDGAEDSTKQEKYKSMTYWNYKDGFWVSVLHPDVKIPAHHDRSHAFNPASEPEAFKQKMKFLLGIATKIKNSIPVTDVVMSAEKTPQETKPSARPSDGQSSVQETASDEKNHNSDSVSSISVASCLEEREFLNPEKDVACEISETARPEATSLESRESCERPNPPENSTLVSSSRDACDRNNTSAIIGARESSKSISSPKGSSQVTTMGPIVVSKCSLYPQKSGNSIEKNITSKGVIVGLKKMPTNVGKQKSALRKKQSFVTKDVRAPTHKVPNTRATDATSRAVGRTVGNDARHTVNVEVRDRTGARRKTMSSMGLSSATTSTNATTSTSCAKKNANPSSKNLGSFNNNRSCTVMDKKSSPSLKTSEKSAIGGAKTKVRDQQKMPTAQAHSSTISWRMPTHRDSNNEKAKKAAHIGHVKISQVAKATAKTSEILKQSDTILKPISEDAKKQENQRF